MTNTYDFLDIMQEKVKNHVHSMKKVKPQELGLDSRAGYNLYICDESIAVAKRNDNSLKYYGGFEYIDSQDRIEMGDFVFYFNDDRVVSALEKLNEKQAD